MKLSKGERHSALKFRSYFLPEDILKDCCIADSGNVKVFRLNMKY